jgi:putative glutamine amidotransferase
MAGLLLTGGQDIDPLSYGRQPHTRLGVTDPQRDRWEIALYRDARRRSLPILGICRGIQLMAVAEGGSLYQDIEAEHGSSVGHFPAELLMERLHHRIDIEADSLLHRICGSRSMAVNSIHHQAVREPGAALHVTARSTADGIVEALEDPSDDFVLGIQYHGEALGAVDPQYLALFTAFVSAAARVEL